MVGVVVLEVGVVLAGPWPGWVRDFDVGAGVLLGVSVVALWW